tara:strand:+ start:1354 stop:1704 length:351 start_codon:yes stop_codon:yes gene_type:complete
MDLDEYRDRVLNARNNYSNEIPSAVIHSSLDLNGNETENCPKYKVRRGWFQIIFALMYIGSERGFVTRRSSDLFEKFSNYLNRTGFRDRLTVGEDIKRGDAVLDHMITDLEPRLGK